MGREYPRKQPHEILGVKPDADLDTLIEAFGRQMKRWEPEEHRGDELAVARVRRLKDSFAAMAGKRGFTPEFDRTGVGGAAVPSRDEIVAQMGPVQQRPEKILTRAEKIALFKMRGRVGQLILRWNEHVKFMNDRHKIIDEIRQEQGDRFTRLKVLFRRSDEDLTRWAAERYLRAGGENGHHVISTRELNFAVSRLENMIRFNDIGEINQAYLELVEEAVDLRVSQARQALEIMKRQRRYIDFYVP